MCRVDVNEEFLDFSGQYGSKVDRQCIATRAEFQHRRVRSETRGASTGDKCDLGAAAQLGPGIVTGGISPTPSERLGR